MALLTEKEVRAKYKEFLSTIPGAADVLSDNDYDFYNWCSQYLDYQHIKNPAIEKLKKIPIDPKQILVVENATEEDVESGLIRGIVKGAA